MSFFLLWAVSIKVINDVLIQHFSWYIHRLREFGQPYKSNHDAVVIANVAEPASVSANSALGKVTTDFLVVVNALSLTKNRFPQRSDVLFVVMVVSWVNRPLDW